MRIYTGSYDTCKVSNVFSISGDGGKSCDFGGRVLKELAPKRSWWQVWHDQIGVLDEEENLRFYVESYYETVLKLLDPSIIIRQLKEGDILLCYEKAEDFCHREIAAVWLELYYGIEVREVEFISEKRRVLPRNKYYNSIKEMLESLIKSDIDMHGYTSIAAAYAYDCATKLENEEDTNMYLRWADTLESIHGKSNAI